jgi:hypothetical protein
MQDPDQTQNASVTLRWGTELAKRYTAPSNAEALSLRWSYVVWKRRRWRDDEKLRTGLAQHAVNDLGVFGIRGGDLDNIAESNIVEVGVPYGNRHLWYMPWEFLLAIATTARRAGQSLLVIRRLLGPPIVVPPIKDEKRSTSAASRLPLLFVQSMPGRLRRLYSFDTEYKLVRRALQLRGDGSAESIHVIDTPTLEKLETEVAKAQPSILHLSGVDSREGSIDLGIKDHVGWGDPGFYLQASAQEFASSEEPNALGQDPCADPSLPASAIQSEADHPERLASGTDLGRACKAGPTLVSVNCYHSSSLAADIVSYGAPLAIGFQDEVDNPLMELFFANFYRDLLADGELQIGHVVRNLWRAMEAARREKVTKISASGGNLRGTGIVLWTRDELPLKRPQDFEADASLQNRVTVPPLDKGGARSILDCDIRPFPALNYSLLHNDRSLFKRFVIKTENEGTVFDLRVGVELEVAGSRQSYSTAFDLRDFYVNLSQIRISLTSALLRSLQENVYSSMHVKVLCQGQMVHENTHRILLLPINEWKDDQLNGAWLPSFVLPNDPAVARITRVAKKYLQALTDNPMVGFDGYQRVTDHDCDSVHKQVQAVWNTLLHDFKTGYINPPPAFENQSQRIRTPTQVLAQERGTCIDLSLLLAACLEYVDIYPALFLLSGHAFMGYFTSTAVHDEFGRLFQSYFENPVLWEERGGMSPQPWVLEKDARRHILDIVRTGGLVPLETTFLCTQQGFFDAAQQGRKNLTDPKRFESVFDVKRARKNHVVPLPIGGETR